MRVLTAFKVFIIVVLLFFISVFIINTFRYLTEAEHVPANIVVDTRKVTGFINPNWKGLAQGGEEKGVRMLEDVVPQVSALYPRYIRLDHIYDFYDVVSLDQNNQLSLNWSKLDQTVCDIYHTGAKPFFSLGYMPPALSENGSLIDKPKDWNQWVDLVQKTVEHYSGRSTRLCGGVSGNLLEDIYYEVWNEPDLESFGSWSLYGGAKDYKTLYYYTSVGATRASNVYHFLLGGPATTAAYRNWLQVFADYIIDNKMRIDFISWHHYSQNPSDFSQDLININNWFGEDKYTRFRHLPKIISEWGWDSAFNPVADSEVGAAYTIASIFNLIDQQVELAFSFEIKDGVNPSWGIISHDGQIKPRYQALKMLNLLDRARLQVEGEGTYVSAVASSAPNKITLLLVNFDKEGRNNELVPVTFKNLDKGTYIISEIYPENKRIDVRFNLNESSLKRSILMQPNSIVALQLVKQ